MNDRLTPLIQLEHVSRVFSAVGYRHVPAVIDVELEVPRGKMVALLGGEHTITVGAVLAMAETYSDLSVLYLDAHADMQVTPIRSVDRITIGEGRAGPITMQLQRQFLAMVHGKVPDTHGWLTHVRQPAEVGATQA